MDNFRVELRAVEAALVIRDHGKRRAFGRGDDPEARREGGDLVAMAHPHLMAGTLFPKPFEQSAVFGDIDERPTKFAAISWLHSAAQLVRHGLLTVAYAKDRDARVKHRLRCAGAAF